jgi:SAM-dependent methyltransferase
MTDLRPLLHKSSLQATVDSLRANADLIGDELPVDRDALDSFLQSACGADLEGSLHRLRLRYLAPCDVRRTTLPSGSVDAVVSRAVLEHIPPEIVRDIFRESARIVRTGGVACHIVDNSDHWEHRDKGISRINFLKYSDAAFRWTCVSGLNYQNRLRHSEYRRMLEDAGFEIERDEKTIDPEALELLERFPVAPRFKRFLKDDLATVTSFFLARQTGR